MLLFSATLLAIIAVFKKRRGDVFSMYWTVLAIVFLFLSVDEASSIHELATLPILKRFDSHGLLYYPWVIPGIIFVTIMAAFYRKFVFQLPEKTRRLMLIAATLYLGGAIGIELIGGWHHKTYGDDNLTYSFITTAEELLEMAGIIVFIHALLHYMITTIGEVRFSFGSIAMEMSTTDRHTDT